MQQDHDNSQTADSSFDRIPPALLSHVLLRVPQQQRLTAASRVCSDWHKAAAGVTTHVKHKAKSRRAIESLQSWVSKYAGSVESLELEIDDKGWPWSTERAENRRTGTQLQLPLAQMTALTSLAILGYQSLPITLVASGEAPSTSTNNSLAPLLPHLKHLELKYVECSIAKMLRLATNPGLTSLALSDMGSASWVNETAAWSSLMQQLPNLKLLKLDGMSGVKCSIVKPIANTMQQLQALELCLRDAATGNGFAELPSTLTKLVLTDHRLDHTLEPALPAQLTQLSNLLHLRLVDCRIPPTLLDSIVGTRAQLRRLELISCSYLPCYDRRLVEPGVFQGLMRTVQQRLTRLEDLMLSLVSLSTYDLDSADMESDDSYPDEVLLEVFAILTASTQLTRLFVQPAHPEGGLLSAGAIQHMFPAGRTLPHLRQLHLCGPYDEYCEDNDRPYSGAQFLQGQDLSLIVSACPHLEKLEIADDAVHPSADLSPLLQLPDSCKHLHIGGAAFTTATANLIAQLTQLTRLSWCHSPALTDNGLRPLTALRALEELCISDCGLSDTIYRLRGDGALQTYPWWNEGPVWRVLRDLLARVDARDYY